MATMVKRYRDTKSMVYYRVDSGQKIPVIIRLKSSLSHENKTIFHTNSLYSMCPQR